MDETGIEKPNEIADGSDRPPIRARISSFSITGLFVLAVCYTLYYAQAILMPITAAVILTLLLQPVVRFLARAKVPEPIAAGVVVVAFFFAFTVGIYFLSDPAAKWMSQMPDVVSRVQEKVKAPMKQIKDAKKEIENMVEETPAESKDAPPHDPQQSKAPQPAAEQASPETTRVSLLEIFTRTFPVLRDVGWSVLIVFVLLYFLLATGTTLRENIILALPTLRDKKRALAMSRDLQRGVSAHLATVTLINIGLGVAIGLAMYAIGLPNPALWGAMAAIVNFIPYIGPIVGSVVVAIVGLVTFDAPAGSLPRDQRHRRQSGHTHDSQPPLDDQSRRCISIGHLLGLGMGCDGRFDGGSHPGLPQSGLRRERASGAGEPVPERPPPAVNGLRRPA